jgi:SAM-dependent methyltransferase
MDPLRFFPIVERDLDLQNPMHPGTLDRLAAAADVRDGARVLDVGSGKGAALRRWARAHTIDGTGLELNPAFVRDARERAIREGTAERLRFVEGPATAFPVGAPAYDVVACLGATFALGSFDEAVAWLGSALRPGGALVLGDRYLEEPLGVASRDEIAELPDLAGVHERLSGHGFVVTAVFGSTRADWDRYVSAWWTAADAWARENPDDPDRERLLATVAADRDRYLRVERRHVGWAAWVARRR